jgi:16S rRNA (guanine1207-N2)-methyltransferase
MIEAHPAVKALWHPFQLGALKLPSKIGVLRAQPGPYGPSPEGAKLICHQSFKPQHDALLSAAYECGEDFDELPMMWVLPTKQRDESRILLAKALSFLQEGGTMVVSVANDEGAKSIESDVKLLVGNVTTISKNKCRIFWATKHQINTVLMNAWLAMDQPTVIDASHLYSVPGVFSWDRIDSASALLVDYLPTTLSGLGADLGAGNGYLTQQILIKNPNIQNMHAYEAEKRALDCARLNVQLENHQAAVNFYWHDVTKGLPQSNYDFIISNPPFHLGRVDMPEIGKAFILSAAKALKPDGVFWLVANAHLPYEKSLQQHFQKVECVIKKNGFKIYAAHKAKK